jgi:hypothetical protein
MSGGASEDSDNDELDEVNNTVIRIDDWITFKADSDLIQSMLHLRQKWSALLLRRLKCPAKPTTVVI